MEMEILKIKELTTKQKKIIELSNELIRVHTTITNEESEIDNYITLDINDIAHDLAICFENRYDEFDYEENLTNLDIYVQKLNMVQQNINKTYLSLNNNYKKRQQLFDKLS